MSIEIYIEITCDFCGIADHSSAPKYTAEKVFKSNGWRFKKGVHACTKRCMDKLLNPENDDALI